MGSICCKNKCKKKSTINISNQLRKVGSNDSKDMINDEMNNNGDAKKNNYIINYNINQIPTRPLTEDNRKRKKNGVNNDINLEVKNSKKSKKEYPIEEENLSINSDNKKLKKEKEALAKKEKELSDKEAQLSIKENEISEKEKINKKKEDELKKKENDLILIKKDISQRENKLNENESNFLIKQNQLDEKEKLLKKRKFSKKRY